MNVKPEPIESTLPRKRLSNDAFGSQNEDRMVIKKPKQELEKIPLAQVNRNTIMAKKEAAPVSLPVLDVAAIRAKIDSTQMQISHTQALLDIVQRKRKKTKSDLTRLVNYSNALIELRMRKASLDASLPRATSPIKRTASKPLTKTESLTKLPPFYNPALVAATPKPEPFSHLPFRAAALHNAVASSSKGPARRALSDLDSGDEMDVDPVSKYLHAIPNIAPVAGEDHHDANGDYHGRGRDTFVGPQAKADDIDKFLLLAGNAEQFDGDASIETALAKLGLQSTHELLPSLDIPLMPHQLLGVAWMVETEKADIKGGCLADEASPYFF
jgi:hypothetical protein